MARRIAPRHGNIPLHEIHGGPHLLFQGGNLCLGGIRGLLGSVHRINPTHHNTGYGHCNEQFHQGKTLSEPLFLIFPVRSQNDHVSLLVIRYGRFLRMKAPVSSFFRLCS